MNRITYEDVAKILAMRDEELAGESSDEDLVMRISAALPGLPKRNGSFVSLTRDSIALCYCLLYSSEPEVKEISRRALRYLIRVDDYWSDTAHDGDGTLDDQLVLAMAAQEIRRRYGVTSGYSGPVVDPVMAHKIEERLAALRDKPVSDAFLIAGARTRMMELELMNVGRLARRLKWNISEVVAVLRDIFAPEERRDYARSALAYLLEEKDEIPDSFGVVGLIDDNYAMVHALEKGGSRAARSSVALDRVVARWPWLLNMIFDDGRYVDTFPDWLILCTGALQRISVLGGGERLVALSLPVCDCLPTVFAFVSAIALLEQRENGRQVPISDRAGGADGEVRAVDRVLWTRRPCDFGSISCRVVLVTDLASCESAVNGISLLGESLGEAVTWGYLNENASIDENPCPNPAVLVSPEIERALVFCNGPSRERRIVIIDSSTISVDSETLLALRRADADVMLLCEHRNEAVMEEADMAAALTVRAGRGELGGTGASGSMSELLDHPLLNLERRVARCLRRRITPHLVRCGASADLESAVERLAVSATGSLPPALLEETLVLSKGLLQYPGPLAAEGAVASSLSGLLRRLSDLSGRSEDPDDIRRALDAFAEKISIENSKFERLLEIVELRGRVSLVAFGEPFESDLVRLKDDGLFPSVVDLVGFDEKLAGSTLEECPQIIPGWQSHEVVLRHLEPPKVPEAHLLLYPGEYRSFKERELRNIRLRRARRAAGLTAILAA